MSAINGTVRNGQIVLDEPVDWPDGTEVLVKPLLEEPAAFNRDDDTPPTPEEIARQLALMDQIEPLIMTAEEEAEWQEARRRQKEYEKAHFDEWAEELRRMWE
jgi:hypothetical protein